LRPYRQQQQRQQQLLVGAIIVVLIVLVVMGVVTQRRRWRRCLAQRLGKRLAQPMAALSVYLLLSVLGFPIVCSQYPCARS
jgi:multisubunit Na+/H+ antiporter MnhB subunit